MNTDGDPQEAGQTAASAAQQDPGETRSVSAVLRQVDPVFPSEAAHEERSLVPGRADDDPGQAETPDRS